MFSRPSSNALYRDHYQKLMIAVIICLFLMFGMVIVLLYQVSHRPLPQFIAQATNNQKMNLISYDQPNLMTPTLTKWVSKAAVAAYTYDFVNSAQQLANAELYFTPSAWSVFQSSINPLIQSIQQNQLFVNGVVVGAPVISNQGELPGKGYVWRIQMPFLVTYQSSDNTTRKTFTLRITIVRVPTWQNPAGIGIDQFVM